MTAASSHSIQYIVTCLDILVNKLHLALLYPQTTAGDILVSHPSHHCTFLLVCAITQKAFTYFFQTWYTHEFGSAEEPCFKVTLNF